MFCACLYPMDLYVVVIFGVDVHEPMVAFGGNLRDGDNFDWFSVHVLPSLHFITRSRIHWERGAGLEDTSWMAWATRIP